MQFSKLTLTFVVVLFLCGICACSVGVKSATDSSKGVSEIKVDDTTAYKQLVDNTFIKEISPIDSSSSVQIDTSLFDKDSLFSEELVVNKIDTISRQALNDFIDSLDIMNFLAGGDSVAILDSLANRKIISPSDTIQRTPGMLDQPAFSTARDSVIEDFSGKEKMIYYYGDVSVKYGNMEMKADYMEYNIDKQTVYVSGVADSLGNVSKPEMTESGKTYTMENAFYNFRTRKARIKNMVTKEQEGILHGEKIKMMPNQSINISGGKYTVCDLEHPHYYLKMTIAKMETKPRQKTVFGPAYLVVEEVPIPVPLPFGFVPKRPMRASGILFPSFGEEQARGFYLKDGGFYFVLGDYLDVALTGDFYSKGSWSAKLNTRYKLRYKFDGSFSLSYSSDVTGEKGSTDYSRSDNFGVQWSHAQDSKARPGTSFRASVNFSTPSNNKYNSHSLDQALSNQVSSSISYSKTWSKMSLSINGLHSQNSRDSSYSITLPNITFNVNKFYPFKRKNRVGKERFYEQFSMSYNTAFQNKIAFKSSEVKDPDFWKKMKTGMTHRFSIGLPSFTLLKYLNFTPTVNYGMNWYFQSQNKVYNPETDKLETVTSNQFGDFGATHDFSASLSLGTRIYGTFNSKNPKSKLRAVRHVITPSLSFMYKPEHGTKINGFRTYTYTDVNGKENVVEYNKWDGGVNSPPSRGQSASISFSIGNNIEAKMLDKNDTTGVGTKKVKLIDQLQISGGYNFLADSMKLSPFMISANTTIFQKVGINANMALDPYGVDSRGNRHNQFNIVQEGGFKLLRMTNASASINFSISGEAKGKGNDGSNPNVSSNGAAGGGFGESGRGGGGGAGPGIFDGGATKGVNFGTSAAPYTKVYYNPITGEYIPGGWVYYLNPNVPWALTLSYNYSYSLGYETTNGTLKMKHNHTQTLGVTAQVRLTKDLNFNVTTGLDFSKFQLTSTQLSATYDLHCFQISFSWIPSGQWASWSFRINAKAAALADLLQYKKSSSYWDNK